MKTKLLSLVVVSTMMIASIGIDGAMAASKEPQEKVGQSKSSSNSEGTTKKSKTLSFSIEKIKTNSIKLTAKKKTILLKKTNKSKKTFVGKGSLKDVKINNIKTEKIKITFSYPYKALKKIKKLTVKQKEKNLNKKIKAIDISKKGYVISYYKPQPAEPETTMDPDLESSDIPTATPITNPTTNPTETPSESPTESPTETPIINNTNEPTPGENTTEPIPTQEPVKTPEIGDKEEDVYYEYAFNQKWNGSEWVNNESQNGYGMRLLKVNSNDIGKNQTMINGYPVNNADYLFANYSEGTLNINSLDTKNIESMAHMFENCKATEITMGSTFNTEKVKDMSYLIAGTIYFPLADFNLNTNNVENMEGMFNNTLFASLNLYISTKNTTNMDKMFQECRTSTLWLSNQFDMSKVTSCNNMFEENAFIICEDEQLINILKEKTGIDAHS